MSSSLLGPHGPEDVELREQWQYSLPLLCYQISAPVRNPMAWLLWHCTLGQVRRARAAWSPIPGCRARPRWQWAQSRHTGPGCPIWMCGAWSKHVGPNSAHDPTRDPARRPVPHHYLACKASVEHHCPTSLIYFHWDYFYYKPLANILAVNKSATKVFFFFLMKVELYLPQQQNITVLVLDRWLEIINCI